MQLPTLTSLLESPRVSALSVYDAHREGTQYDHLRYLADGSRAGMGAEGIIPGYYVPQSERRPAFNPHLCRMLTTRLTAFMLQGGFTLSVDGDPEASQFVADVARDCQLAATLNQLRDLGGACGTAVVSFDFVAGRVVFSVHEARHMHVVEWEDRACMRPSTVLKVYATGDGAEKRVHAHMWTPAAQLLWKPIPWGKAGEPGWESLPHTEVPHDFGFCPVYITQNLRSLHGIDGLPDIEDMASVDAWTRSVSALHTGVSRNMDPTLVVHMDPTTIGPGAVVRKGSDNAIFSEKGASYMTLASGAADAGMQVIRYELELLSGLAGVTIPSADDARASARSAAALKMLYAPMIAQCDKLRVQYGESLIAPLMHGVMRAARKAGKASGQVIQSDDGRLYQVRPGLTQLGADNRPLDPGTGEQVRVTWGAYFEPTSADKMDAVKLALEARGKLISHRTAMTYVASIFGVADVEEEMRRLAAEEDEQALRLAAASPDEFGKRDEEEPEHELDMESEAEEDDRPAGAGHPNQYTTRRRRKPDEDE